MENALAGLAASRRDTEGEKATTKIGLWAGLWADEAGNEAGNEAAEATAGMGWGERAAAVRGTRRQSRRTGCWMLVPEGHSRWTGGARADVLFPSTAPPSARCLGQAQWRRRAAPDGQESRRRRVRATGRCDGQMRTRAKQEMAASLLRLHQDHGAPGSLLPKRTWLQSRPQCWRRAEAAFSVAAAVEAGGQQGCGVVEVVHTVQTRGPSSEQQSPSRPAELRRACLA
ncbi:hypothetical protein P280DRAFT_149506 [Massarina eburnea CBS 473.64]|uniref:Uncharacterized protein n=1 Tax=Massarina eburnea CBS 473.64 TaxID=1395130 RepID=A0A6A6RR55_9PLEO|nr:hypothetical protein P280DRAFT_149506 [Massarina eburnea CBS 473.64]